MLGIMICLGCKMFFHLYVLGLSVIYNNFTKIKWNCKINEKWDTIIKQGVLNNLKFFIGVHLHKNTITNQLHILGLFNLFNLKNPNQLYVIFRRIQKE